MYKNLTIASFLGLLAVVLGAFGAHILKNKLSLTQLNSFETAVRYQMYHVLVVLFVNIFSGFTRKERNIITRFFFAGILCFSGSIYTIQLAAIPAKSIWFITPLGGLLFVIGWALMILYFSKKKSALKSE